MAVLDDRSSGFDTPPPGRSLPRTGGAALALPVKLYLLAVALPVAFFVGPIYMTPLRLLALIMVVPLFGMILTGRYGGVKLPDILLFLHGLWIVIALAVNNPDRLLQSAGVTLLELYGGYFLARVYIRDRAAFVALGKWIVVLVLLTVPLAVYEALTARPILVDLINSLPGIRSVENVRMPSRMGLDRAQTVFAHPILYGLFCSLCFPMLVLVLRHSMRQAVFVAVALCVLAGVFLSLSSGAILAVVVQVFLMSWDRTFRRWPKRWWIFLALTVLAYIAVDVLSNRTPIRVFMSYATFSPHNAYYRGLIFEWGLRNVLGSVEHDIPSAFWFGIGLTGDWVRPSFMHSSTVDNFWLVLAMRYGVPGFLLLTGAYLSALILVMRRDLGPDEELRRIKWSWIVLFAGMSFTLATVHVWTVTYSYVFFLLGAGLWITDATARTGEDPASEAGAEARAPVSRYTRFPPRRDI